MALQTQIVRDGAPIPLAWGFWHVTVMQRAADAEGVDIIKTGYHVMKNDATYEDPFDGEVLALKAGDQLKMWNER